MTKLKMIFIEVSYACFTIGNEWRAAHGLPLMP